MGERGGNDSDIIVGVVSDQLQGNLCVDLLCRGGDIHAEFRTRTPSTLTQFIDQHLCGHAALVVEKPRRPVSQREQAVTIHIADRLSSMRRKSTQGS